MDAFALLFSLAAIGVSETVYLIRQRKHSQHAFCVIGQGCTQVLESKYNTFLGIHNDVLGLVFYAGMGIMTALYVLGVEPLWVIDRLTMLMVAGGASASLIFTYIQARILKAWCFWCLMSAITTWLMTIIVIAHVLGAF
jgi:uncharacterized membrane protein